MHQDALAALAARFVGNPAVAGYELLNEPEPGYVPPGAIDPTELFPFYAKVIAAVRARVLGFRQLFIIEPDITRDILDRSVVVGPWSLYSPYPNVVYAPHVYARVFTLNAELGLSQLNAAYPSNGGYDSAAQDARSLRLALWWGSSATASARTTRCCAPVRKPKPARGRRRALVLEGVRGPRWPLERAV